MKHIKILLLINIGILFSITSYGSNCIDDQRIKQGTKQIIEGSCVDPIPPYLGNFDCGDDMRLIQGTYDSCINGTEVGNPGIWVPEPTECLIGEKPYQGKPGCYYDENTTKFHYVRDVTEFREALTESKDNGMHDTIVLAAGEYHTISGGFNTTFDEYDSNEPYNLAITADRNLTHKDVILDGDGITQVLNVKSNDRDTSLYLHGLSIINGNGQERVYGVGIYTNKNLYISDCNVSNNIKAVKGGGIYMDGGNLIISDSIIAYNTSNEQSGGIENHFSYGITKISNSIITHNTTTSNGGGIQCDSLTLEHSQVTYNIAGNVAGGIEAHEALITDSNISYNQSDKLGGGMFIDNTLILRNSIVNNNTLVSDSIGGCTGSAFSVNGELLIDRSLFKNNHSSCPGQGAVFKILSKNFILTNSIFANNVTSNTNGQASIFFARGMNNATVSNNTFLGKSGENFIQIELYDHIYFMNNIFDSNLSQVVYFEKDAVFYHNYIDPNTISHHSSASINIQNILDPNIVGEIKLASDQITLKNDSPAIDQGLNLDDPIYKSIIENDRVYKVLKILLKVDYFKHKRIFNQTVDVGASEFGSGN